MMLKYRMLLNRSKANARSLFVRPQPTSHHGRIITTSGSSSYTYNNTSNDHDVCRIKLRNFYSTSKACRHQNDTPKVEISKVEAGTESIPDHTPPISLEEDEDDDYMEDMYVEPDVSLGPCAKTEWGGPRRGGRYSEPTRFGDWERKGRCTDF